jgi:hypothetical protein
MEQIDRILMKIKPTEEQRIEIIKKVMNYKQPTRPEGVQSQNNVSWTCGEQMVKLLHDAQIHNNSTFKVTVKNAANQLQYEVQFSLSTTEEILVFYRQEADVACVKYIFDSNGQLVYTRYIDYISQERNDDMSTSGKVNPNSFLYKKYDELKSTAPPTTLAAVASPEITTRVNEWVTYLSSL